MEGEQCSENVTLRENPKCLKKKRDLMQKHMQGSKPKSTKTLRGAGHAVANITSQGSAWCLEKDNKLQWIASLCKSWQAPADFAQHGQRK